MNHDIAAALEGIAPRDGRYLHEETWHDDNGPGHPAPEAARGGDGDGELSSGR